MKTARNQFLDDSDNLVTPASRVMRYAPVDNEDSSNKDLSSTPSDLRRRKKVVSNRYKSGGFGNRNDLNTSDELVYDEDKEAVR